MRTYNLSTKEIAFYLSVSLAIGGIVWLLTEQMQRFELGIFDQAIRSLRLSNGPAQDQIINNGNLAENICLWLTLSTFCLVGFAAGFKIDGAAKIFSWLQLLAASVLFQWAAWTTFHAQGHPIGLTSAFTFGILAGSVFKLYAKYSQKQEAQFYALLLRNKELQEARVQMVKQDEIERRMLAADLHDEVLNDLKALKQKIDTYKQVPHEATAADIEELLQKAMTEIREVMDSLCPSALEHLGLIAAIEDCVKRGAERANLKFRFKNNSSPEDTERLTAVEKSLLYRIVQESVTNVCKHAEASLVRTTIELQNHDLVIAITDDGKGMHSKKVAQDSRGLRYIKQRADLIGAAVSWFSGQNGTGTTVEVRLNLQTRKTP
jgi:signal transduction histidine kinase